MAKLMKKLKEFFTEPEEDVYVFNEEKIVEQPQKKDKPKQQKRKIYTFDDLTFHFDNYSVYADKGASIYSSLKFDNGYKMYISYVNFIDNYLYSHADFLKHDSPAAYKITITDAKNGENNTCLNKDGKSIFAYNKNDVTKVMKQIQQLDENGQLPQVDIKAKIEARKSHIKKARDLRKELEKRNKEDGISGVVVADNIAEKIISGKENRQITPDVVAEYKKQSVRDK